MPSNAVSLVKGAKASLLLSMCFFMIAHSFFKEVQHTPTYPSVTMSAGVFLTTPATLEAGASISWPPRTAMTMVTIRFLMPLGASSLN